MIRIAESLHHIVTKTAITLLFAAISLSTANVVFSPAMAGETQPPLYKITIPMETGEDVTVVTSDGGSYVVGQVTALPQTTRWPSYSASAWGDPGDV